MKKIILLASLLTATIAAITQEPIKAKANDPYNLIGTGVSIIYNSDKDGGDYGWITTRKKMRMHPSSSSMPPGLIDGDNYVILGFDAPEVKEITRMGFEVTYKKPNFWQSIGNSFLEAFGGVPKYGELKSDSVLVKSDVTYTFVDETNVYNFNNPNDDKFKFNAIGRVSDLLETEESYWNEVNSIDTSVYPYNLYPKGFFGLSGGYYYRYNYKDRLNDSSKSLANREYYAIVPYRWTEKIQPESIKCYLMDGTLIDDGLDEDGNAYVDPITEDYYIDLTVGRDVGVAINGTNARVTRIEISGYDNLNDTGILIQNSNFDYATQSTTNVVQQKLFVGNTTYNANWTITNENRYIFIKFDGELDDASKLKVRVFYRNDNAKQSWIIRVTDADGNFLPPPYETVPTVRPKDTDDRWKNIVTLIGVGILGLVALYGISKLFEILANVKRAVS